LTSPAISVLMPIYNCSDYVSETIDSILNQTFTDFEFLIIDDCSTDLTADIVKQYRDSRIKLIEKPVNTGYTDSLNLGVELAQGKYIARMDGDDIAISTRFEQQINLLESNPEVIVCGSQLKILGSDKIMLKPESHEDILIDLLLTNPIGHPSVMIRRSVLTAFKYDKSKEPAEDYDLWTRLIWHGKFYNIQQPLVLYRVHDGQVSTVKKQKQLLHFNESRINFLKKLGYDDNIFPNALLMHLFFQDYSISAATFRLLMQWFATIQKANKDQKIFPESAFFKTMNEMQHAFLRAYFITHKFEAKIIPCWFSLKPKQVLFVIKAYILAANSKRNPTFKA